jgi:hypothetical protein
VNEADMFTSEEYQHFLALVGQYFEREGIKARVEDSAVIVERPVKQVRQARYGLDNLARVCRQQDQSEWGTSIANHFNKVRAGEAERNELDRKVHDFSQISDLLAVRLWPIDYLDEIGPDHLVYREDLEGVISVLVFHLPHSIRQVWPETAASWKKDSRELFEIGLENVRKKSIPEISRYESEDGVELILLSDESFLVTTHALLLDEHPDCIGADGALVGVPQRQALLCYPIDGSDVLKVIKPFTAMIDLLYRDGPGSISPNLYWYHDGRYTNLPFEMTDDEFTIKPPEAFVELLKSYRSE